MAEKTQKCSTKLSTSLNFLIIPDEVFSKTFHIVNIQPMKRAQVHVAHNHPVELPHQHLLSSVPGFSSRLQLS